MLTLNTVMLGSDNAEGLVECYSTIFDRKPDWTGGPYSGWKMGEMYLMIGPHDDVKGHNDMPGRIIINFVTDDVEGEFKRLAKAGISIVAEPNHPGGGSEGWMATMFDADGNFFQLVSPMPGM